MLCKKLEERAKDEGVVTARTRMQQGPCSIYRKSRVRRGEKILIKDIEENNGTSYEVIF